MKVVASSLVLLGASLLVPTVAAVPFVAGIMDVAGFEAYKEAGFVRNQTLEARFGDSSNRAEWEIGFAYETYAPFSPQNQMNWLNDVAIPWSLEWDGTQLKFTIGSAGTNMLTSNNPSSVPFGGVVIEAKALPRTVLGVDQGEASILMDNLVVDDTVSLTGSAFAETTGQRIQLIAIAGLDTSGWKLSGTSFMSWTPPYLPSSKRVGSRLGFQLKVGLPPLSGDVIGDPHFKTWAGSYYDFHGACDMVFLHNPKFEDDLGMDIHIRTKGMHDMYSYVETAAVRIGDDILEVSSYGAVAFNGVADAETPFMMADKFLVTYEEVNKKRHKVHVKLDGKGELLFNVYKNMVTVGISNVTMANFGESVGLMGQPGTGALIGRDGKTILEDPIEFAQQWQVTDKEPQLFMSTDSYPQYPTKCVMPEAGQVGRRLGESKIAKADAEKACAEFREEDKAMCVYDIMITEDMEAANSFVAL